MNPDPAEAARFLASYAKQYHAGAFATPTRKDIEAGAVRIVDYRHGDDRTLLAVKRLSRVSIRRDFAGARYEIPAGATIVSDIARTPNATIPDLSGYDIVCAYIEDQVLTSGLIAQGRGRFATQITAAGELIGIWGDAGSARQVKPIDAVTVSRLPERVADGLLKQAQQEAAQLSGWFDDYPFYSDGSWGALSVRGFDRNPQWGVKPREMSKKWQAENPDALSRECVWTDLAERVPSVVELATTIAQSTRLERVRLLRMAAGRPTSHLGRHTDITDRFGGPHDGQVIRYHVPLVTHEKVTMSVWDLDGVRHDKHLAAGTAWYLDARKPHSVTNASPVDRVHLVIDLGADDHQRQRILSGETV